MKYYLSAPECIFKPVREYLLAEKTNMNYLISFANGVSHWERFYNNGANTLMIDSGAFSAWNSGKTICINQYLEFCKSLPEDVFKINLDVIPKTNSTQEEKKLCIKQSFDNFLFLSSKVKNVLPVHHYGECISWAFKMLDHTDYICISPANDTHENIKREYFNYIYANLPLSTKAHVLGYSSVKGVKLYPFYSCDSISYKQTHMNGNVMLLRSDNSIINLNMFEYAKYKKLDYTSELGLSAQPEILEAGTLDTINSIIHLFNSLEDRNKTHNFNYLKSQLSMFGNNEIEIKTEKKTVEIIENKPLLNNQLKLF